MIETNYYSKNKKKIIKRFQELTETARKVADASYDQGTIDALAELALQELDKLIPQLPYVGGDKSPFTPLIIDTVETVAFYRACNQLGIETREIGRLLYMIAETFTTSLSTLKKKIAKWMLFSRKPISYIFGE